MAVFLMGVLSYVCVAYSLFLRERIPEAAGYVEAHPRVAHRHERDILTLCRINNSQRNHLDVDVDCMRQEARTFERTIGTTSRHETSQKRRGGVKKRKKRLGYVVLLL